MTGEGTRRTDRKTSGSYYTPLSLVDCLLDTALDPLIAEAAGKPDPERALAEVTVCDPACGAGVFLVRASRRVAARLAAVRAAGREPAAAERERARRDVASRQIYGVDLNPLAVDLTRLCLAAEAAAPSAPNPFLEHHIKYGNALLGATPALLAGGIPDAAFTPIEGDDRKVAAALRKRNRAERQALTGAAPASTQMGLFDRDGAAAEGTGP